MGKLTPFVVTFILLAMVQQLTLSSIRQTNQTGFEMKTVKLDSGNIPDIETKLYGKNFLKLMLGAQPKIDRRSLICGSQG